MITHLAAGGAAGGTVAAVTLGAAAAAGDEGHVGDAEVTSWSGGAAKGLEEGGEWDSGSAEIGDFRGAVSRVDDGGARRTDRQTIRLCNRYRIS